MGEGSRGLGKNQQGLRVGCCEMVGDYYDDSSIKENLNLLLCLARVETSVNSRNVKEYAGTQRSSSSTCRCWGLPQQLCATDGC